ncbi:hypothetical protein, partial [Streptomyces cacaoi]|uniref:hypothetical protein n=1 Tax=Streptomyces cacaoi TaxID=1898 RepID=UPI003747B64D
RWTAVAALRDEGCPNCGKGPFRPGRLVPAEDPTTPAEQPPTPAQQAAPPQQAPAPAQGIHP